MQKYFFIFITFLSVFLLIDTKSVLALERSGRWITDDGSHPYLIGYDLQQLFTDSAYTEEQIESRIDTLAAYGTTAFRIWLNTWFMDYDDYYPYTYSGGKFNLDSFDTAYWTRVKNLTNYAKSKGIIVEVVVFSEYPNVAGNDYWTGGKVFWRKAENINNVFSDVSGDLYPEFFTVNYSESGKNLTTYQLGLAEKAINELDPIGNVFFQVHNEFPAIFGGTGQYVDQVHGWQEYMADYFHDTKGAITSVHAHEGSTMQLYGLDYWKSRPSVDILNFHPYSSTSDSNIDAIGSMFGTLYSYGKVLMFDESHAFEDANFTDTVTREMWASFTNGIYYLAYTGDNFIIGDSGWTTRAGRILTLKNISEMGDWWNATRNPALVTAGPGSYWQGIANSGSFYVYYFTGTKTTTAVSMTLPEGDYDYKFYNTISWDSDGIASGSINSSGGSVSISAPPTSSWNGSTGVVLVVNESGPIVNDPPSAPTNLSVE